MDEAGKDFLAGAGRAVDQNGDFAGSQALGEGEDRKALGIGGDRHARRGDAGEQRCQGRFAGGIAIGERDSRGAVAEDRGILSAMQRHQMGARRQRGTIGQVAQQNAAAVPVGVGYRTGPLDQRRMLPRHGVAKFQTAHFVMPPCINHTW